MTLSTATNPLTAPLPPPSHSQTTVSAAQNALSRFATPGNAILTGGAGSLALATARALLEHGTTALTLLDLPSTLSSPVSTAAISTLRVDFPAVPIHTLPVNVTSASEVTRAFAEASALMDNRIDMLACFAGVVGCTPALDMGVDEWRRTIDVNLTGSFLCAQAAARHMVVQNEKRRPEIERAASPASRLAGAASDAVQGGSMMRHNGIPSYAILFTSSISAHATNYPQPQSAYNASKTALQSLTKSLAAEWCVHGIRVNSVSPGYLDTTLNAGDGLSGVRAAWAQKCPMGRMGAVEEVVGIVVGLMSPRAGRYVTGSDVIVDGGTLCF